MHAFYEDSIKPYPVDMNRKVYETIRFRQFGRFVRLSFYNPEQHGPPVLFIMETFGMDGVAE